MAYRLVCLVLLLIGSALATASPGQADGDAVRTRIAHKIDFYNGAFPEIQFLHLEGGHRWAGDMMSLLLLLSPEVSSLDYEHPPALRGELLLLSLRRLERMLQRDIVSASTFRIPRSPDVQRTTLCVITLNPAAVLRDDREATRYMLNFSEAEMTRVHPARYLDHLDHLDFAIDHEAYHCLEAHQHGGVPPTREALDGEYHAVRSECSADAYAMAMHLRAHEGITPYARNLLHLRALWPYTHTPDHGTFETLQAVLQRAPAELSALADSALVAWARRITDAIVGDLERFSSTQAAALQAASRLGFDIGHYNAAWQALAAYPADPARVEALVRRFRRYDAALSDTREIALDPSFE